MSNFINDLVPSYICELAPYVPGRPIEEVERELNMRAIKLASNENPLGPSPLAIEAAKKVLSTASISERPCRKNMQSRQKILFWAAVPLS
jgi:histidinol-phosphate/aromatic aminotransferase/cobyric acid decarboxylase-like protein